MDEEIRLLRYGSYTILIAFVTFIISMIFNQMLLVSLETVVPFFLFCGVLLLSVSGIFHQITYKPLGSKIFGGGAVLVGLYYLIFAINGEILLTFSYFDLELPQFVMSKGDLIIMGVLSLVLQILPTNKPTSQSSTQAKENISKISSKSYIKSRKIKQEDLIDFTKQEEFATKMISILKGQSLFYWDTLISVDRDIGGKLFNDCPYCGGEKDFINGDQDDEDSTEQYIYCKVCGWKGYRKIKYQRYGNPRCIFRISRLVDLENVYENQDKKRDLNLIFEYFGCDIQYIEKLYIDWEHSQIVFVFVDTNNFQKDIVLNFEESYRLLNDCGIYNKNLPSLNHLRDEIKRFEYNF